MINPATEQVAGVAADGRPASRPGRTAAAGRVTLSRLDPDASRAGMYQWYDAPD